ncbi:LNR domain protein [Pelomyxa schiedti]|nr:LNR domain protein [Pelomyxa schiedti]
MQERIAVGLLGVIVIVVGTLICLSVANEGWSWECDDEDDHNVGDGTCDIECYTATYNWDGGDCNNTDQCNLGCEEDDIGDEWCDPWCMTEACEFDGGDCGVSTCGNWSCNGTAPADGTCDYECATEDCLWDSGDCLYLNCGPQCYPDYIGDGNCGWGCNNEECNFDGGDCESYCSPDCSERWNVGNSHCDQKCYTEACNWDGGDCDTQLAGYCYFGCLQTHVGDGTCQSSCFNNLCNWDAGDCDGATCNGGSCFLDQLGDGRCDYRCNVEDCDWDGGDCVLEYVYIDVYTTDDDCHANGTVLTVTADYCKNATTGNCARYTEEMTCTDYNHWFACIPVADFESRLDSWFQEEPLWEASWDNPQCEGTPSFIHYYTGSPCVLIDNSLWGYWEWADGGLLILWQCTDSSCQNCFVEQGPTSEGKHYFIRHYYPACKSDDGWRSQGISSMPSTSTSGSDSETVSQDSLSLGSILPVYPAIVGLIPIAVGLMHIL